MESKYRANIKDAKVEELEKTVSNAKTFWYDIKDILSFWYEAIFKDSPIEDPMAIEKLHAKGAEQHQIEVDEWIKEGCPVTVPNNYLESLKKTEKRRKEVAEHLSWAPFIRKIGRLHKNSKEKRRRSQLKILRRI